ncbi:hypothetical protein QR680_009394 [Steinernema hermaphroditum]|uniref:Uncharacterized protein n=1 Tax=Steinernema hermaphroditum TaxID=289476 RepID=A0AA39IM56_9BILA|nr:hypothetical protein QR680_009394 [Steinernema hermaphroditum]
MGAKGSKVDVREITESPLLLQKRGFRRSRWSLEWEDGWHRDWRRRWNREWSVENVVENSQRREALGDEPAQRTSGTPHRSTSASVFEKSTQPHSEQSAPPTSILLQRRRSTSDVTVIRREEEMTWRPLSSKRPRRKKLPPFVGPIYSHQIAIPVVEEVFMQPAIPQKKEKGRRFVPKKTVKKKERPPSPFIVRKVPDRSQKVPFLSQ